MKTIVRSKKKTARVDSRGLITKLDKRKTVIKKESPFGYYNLYMKACCCCCCCGSPRYNKPLFSFFFKTILKKLSPQKEGRYSSNPSEYRYTLNSISQVNPIQDYSDITRTNIPYIFHQLSTVYAKQRVSLLVQKQLGGNTFSGELCIEEKKKKFKGKIEGLLTS